MTHTPRPLEELLDPGWARALAPVEPRIHELGAWLREEIAHGRGYLPAGADVLRAFTLPFDRVKVLIVGQDPYPTPGHAMGLSFSVAPGVEIPRSLQNIFTELEADIGCPRPTSGDLSPWAREGVCLLNRVLTVRPGAPASHRGRGWEEVTQCAIDALVNRPGPARTDAEGTSAGVGRAPLVAILWGRDAQNLQPRLQGVPVIASPHPSPLSARRGFFGSRPFSRANELLAEQGAEPVDWALA
ncbi:uracil-DNA glycosylase [Schaalia sp. 19OD2882]|uniref:uracil-DNA glycosylase n=1 Tax=Schaalia sp. 19OD2882 TaxID=2794089 RepID=UPI001C1EFE0C|nr:uracil-DNA glycosylase [Schaalia sp. 19OD2882]QWW19297.1 uracil-DNA glycosylase [Schaalia sp. 19OD2882]